MATVPKKIIERMAIGIKKYQPILLNAKVRDVGEADTVTLLKDILSEIFGYDKYAEITSEYAIRGTYCDLAINLDNHLAILIEAKAIGLDLKEQHVKQAIDYAANQGVDWVLLTNGLIWRVYRLAFLKPIDKELVLEFDMTTLNHRSNQDLEMLYLLCKEGWQKSALGAFHAQKQALSRFFVGAMLQTDPILDVIRRELKRVSPDVPIDIAQIKSVLVNEVIKRDVLDGDKAIEATKKISRSSGKLLRAKVKQVSVAPVIAEGEPT